MGGRHSTPDRRRFYRELLRLILLLLVLAIVAIGGGIWLSSVLGSGDDVIPVSTTAAAGSTTAPSTVASTATSTSTAPTTAATTAPTTTTTAEPSTTTTTLPPVRVPGEVAVLVLNSTTTQGMAGRLEQRFSDIGYVTLDSDNYSPLLETSVVWYADGYEREAQVVAEQVPDATVEPFPGDAPEADVTVVLGSSYSE